MGFNREEVIDYIKKVQKDYNEREKSLLQSLEKLNKRNAELIDLTEKIPQLEMQLKMSEATAEKLATQIADFAKERETVKQTSDSIAKMYLVAKSNAASVEKATSQSSQRVMYELGNTMTMLGEVHKELETLKNSLYTASDDYAKKLSDVMSRFAETGRELENISAQLQIDEKINI